MFIFREYSQNIYLIFNNYINSIMKILNTVSFILMSLVWTKAQITYTNASFLQVGDVLKISTTFDSAMVVTAPDTVATVWDFSGLISTTYVEDTIQAASTGSSFAQFPTADVLGKLIGGFGIAYTDVTTTEMKTVGGGFELGTISIIAPFVDPYVVQKAPITYPNSNNDNFSLKLAQHIDSIPFLRQLIDSINPLSFSPDSLRFSFSGTNNQKVDAFGTCQLPDSTYSVLRQKNTIHTEIKIELYTVLWGSFGTWADVTSLIVSNLPVPFSPKDTIIYYDYLAEGKKQPVVRQLMNNDESAVNSVEFMGESSPQSSLNSVVVSTRAWKIYPNPAQQQLTFLFEEEQTLEQQLQIVDLLGREQHSQVIQGQEVYINVSKWSAGQYIAIIRNNNNKIIDSKRIQVIR